MSLGGSSSSSKPVVNQQGLNLVTQNAGRAQAVANLPYQDYTGELTAGASPNEQFASYAAPGAFAAGQPALDAAQNAGFSLSGYRPPMAATTYARAAQVGPAPQAGPTAINRGDIRDVNSTDALAGISKYQNPYDTSVVDAALGDIERSREIQRRADQQSTPTGAFGGSRQGVADAQTNEAFQRTAANTVAGLRQAGFDRATALAQSDAERAQQAAGANQNADLSVAGQNAGFNFGTNQLNLNTLADFLKFNAANRQATNITNAGAANNMAQFNTNADIAGAGVRQGGATSLANVGNQQHDDFLASLDALSRIGANDRGIQQAADDAGYNEFLRRLAYPLQGQQIINQSLGLVPTTLGQNSSSFGFSLGLK